MKLLFENWRQYTNTLNEEQLLIEGRIEDVKKKYPDLDKRGLLDVIIEKDPSGNQKYLAWAAKRLAAFELAELPTAEYAATNLELYHNMLQLNQIPAEYKDINKITALGQLEQIAHTARRNRQEKERLKKVEEKYKQEAKQNSEILMKDDNFLMVRPMSEGASCFWGRGTKWCISATESENYYNRYTGEGKAFYFLFMKNRNNFMTSDYRKYHKLALVYDPSYGSFEEAYDATDESMDAAEVMNIIGINLLGHEFVDAYRSVEDYGYHLEGEFLEDHPEHHATILATLKEHGMEPDYDLEEFWTDAVENEWYEIDAQANAHFEQAPAGPTWEDFQKIQDAADLQYVWVDFDEYEPGKWYWSGNISFDFDRDHYEFGPPADPLELDDFDLEDEVTEVLDGYSIYPRELEIHGNEIRVDVDTDDPYAPAGIEAFDSHVDTMSEHDANYEEIKAALIDMFIDQGVLDISDEPIGKLKAKLAEKEMKNFDFTSEGRTLESNSNIFEYPEVGIRAGAKDIMELMGHWEMATSGTPDDLTIANRVTKYHDRVAAKIIYIFKQSFQSEEGRSYADNILFDKMDTLLDQAYRDAEKQLTIPGLEQPERKRLTPPLAVGLAPSVYASSLDDTIKIRLYIKADAELGEEQAGYIAEFIDFFDENFDSLHTIVGEVVYKLLKEAVVKALEAVKEEMPDRARALGVDESKKRKKGIKILLGNRR